MPITGRHLVLFAILAAPAMAHAADAANQSPARRISAQRMIQAPADADPTLIDDAAKRSLLPEWHPQGLGDRVSLAMHPEMPGARLTLNVRF